MIGVCNSHSAGQRQILNGTVVIFDEEACFYFVGTGEVADGVTVALQNAGEASSKAFGAFSLQRLPIDA